ncbi:MAG TPA: glycosyltransferase family 4 protein [Dehalococcoidia bacterium]|nr:glycosyltransferase family 4 protein [Dehalococcoidia bacterium]
MHILLVSPYDLTHPGGVTSHVFDLAHQFEHLGHDVLVAGPSGDGPLPQNGYTHHVGSSFRFLSPGDSARVNLNPLVSRSIREFVKGRRFDVVHMHEPFLGFIGPAFMSHTDSVKVGTFHTWREGPHIPYIAFWPLVAYWNRRLDGRVVVSEAARKTISRYIKAEYRLIPNGVDFHRFACPSETGPPPHLADDRPTLLFVGRIEARKGIPYLLKAYRLVKSRLPEARLVIVGEGGLKEEYRRMAAEMGLEDVLFEGYVAPDLLPSYYQRADVFCSPSTVNESFGITLLEAMAAHAPAVATSINGVNTLGENGVTGIIVPPKDPEAMAEGIIRLLEDRALASRLADAAQKRALRYDWEQVARELLAYYEELGA